MGRACMELWTNVHYVLKMFVLILMTIVEFLVLDWSMKTYWNIMYLEGYYFIALSYVVIILYGYTWFDTTVVLEILMVIATIFMMLCSVILYFHEYHGAYRVDIDGTRTYKYNRDKFTIFVTLTVVGIVILIVDLVLLILQAAGKSPGGMGGGGSRSRA